MACSRAPSRMCSELRVERPELRGAAFECSQNQTSLAATQVHNLRAKPARKAEFVRKTGVIHRTSEGMNQPVVHRGAADNHGLEASPVRGTAKQLDGVPNRAAGQRHHAPVARLSRPSQAVRSSWASTETASNRARAILGTTPDCSPRSSRSEVQSQLLGFSSRGNNPPVFTAQPGGYDRSARLGPSRHDDAATHTRGALPRRTAATN
jgi:hypothetical protein